MRLRIKYSQIYENTDILSPIDRETWQVIAETSRLTSSSHVIELASGKGVFALYLAKKFGCSIDCVDRDGEFVEYSRSRACELGLTHLVKFSESRVQEFVVEPATYDLGVCLGALYIFRDAGWRVLMTGVKPRGYLAISDLYCKKFPVPRELMDIFFEEEGEALRLEEARERYVDGGLKILREEECSRKAWLNYYDLIREMLHVLSKKYAGDAGMREEIRKELREDELVRELGDEYLGYLTFIMQKT